jgi:gamma-glutamyl-gamma-aminobutyrate hydrolase PuuD
MWPKSKKNENLCYELTRDRISKMNILFIISTKEPLLAVSRGLQTAKMYQTKRSDYKEKILKMYV